MPSDLGPGAVPLDRVHRGVGKLAPYRAPCLCAKSGPHSYQSQLHCLSVSALGLGMRSCWIGLQIRQPLKLNSGHEACSPLDAINRLLGARLGFAMQQPLQPDRHVARRRHYLPIAHW